MLVALGSTRAPKVEALRRALGALAGQHEHLAGAELAAREVPHAAPPMPLSLQAVRDGARDRALQALATLRAEGRRPDLGVGLEGGLDVENGGGRPAFLTSWAYVTDGRRGAHGCGGAIEVPETVLRRVIDEGRELSEVIDSMVAESDTRSRQGAWGVLTRGLLDRTRSFELALLNALAPFYNSELYA